MFRFFACLSFLPQIYVLISNALFFFLLDNFQRNLNVSTFYLLKTHTAGS